MHFLGYYISALKGCCAMKFSHALEIDPAYLEHTLTETEVPPQKKSSRKLKIWLKIQGVSLNNFGAGAWEYPHETSPDDVP